MDKPEVVKEDEPAVKKKKEPRPLTPRKYAVAMIRKNSVTVFSAVRRPYILRIILADLEDKPPLIGIGFSKVCYPDVWDQGVGFDRALDHAISHIYRQIMLAEPAISPAATLLTFEAAQRALVSKEGN